MKHYKLMMASLLLAIGGGSAVAQTWEDYTSKITNPSFEADEAKGDLTSGWNSTQGWTITPSSAPKYSQVGIANAKTKIQGIGTTFKPSAGDNFFYLRCNWQKTTEFKVSQKLSSKQGLPVGTYKLTCKVANFSSNVSATNYRLSLGDGTNTATNYFSYNEKKWGEWTIIFNKSDASTDLNIEAYMKPNADGSGQYYCLLLDDFKLEYLSDEELAKASPEKPLDLTAAISNSTIYNPTQTSLPKGWSENRKAAGNNNRTEKTGDTQLEGWSEGALNVKYYQTLTNLPSGKYILKANVHDSNVKGAVLYATSGCGSDKQTVTMGKDFAVLSTPVVIVGNGKLEIGIDAPNIKDTWMTGDDFSISYVGFDLSALSQSFSSMKSEAEALLVADEYKNVVGKEKTELATTIKELNPEETKIALEEAFKKLTAAIETFKAAAPSYNNLEDAKAIVETKLPYASASTYTALTAAKNAIPTSASDAIDKANVIIAARRAYVESNGKAEGVNGEDYTSKVVNPTFANQKKGWKEGQDDKGSILNGETWTNADGTKGGNYYDYWNGDNHQHVSQEVANLTPGKYIVTVKARAQQGFWMYLRINDKNVTDINEIGNTGGVFDRGWNDYTAEFTVGADGKVKIEVANMPSSKQAGWFSFGDVRLFRLGNRDVTLDEATDNTFEAMDANVTLKRSFVANKWNTLVLPFAVSAEDVKAKFGNDAKVVEYSNAEDVNINFTTSTNGIKANVPVLIMPAAVNAENTYTFNSVSIVVADPKADGTNYSFVGSYKPYNLVNDDYMLYADKWWKTETGDTYKIKAFRAYIKANTPAAAKQLNLVIDGQTTGLKLNTVNGNIEGETYNIAGQRVANSYKGLIIKNGKKIIKK